MTSPAPALTRAKRRRLIALALLRSLATAVVLVALYYLLPLDRLTSVPLGVLLAIGLVALLAVASWQVRTIIRARHPTVRAIGAMNPASFDRLPVPASGAFGPEADLAWK